MKPLVHTGALAVSFLETEVIRAREKAIISRLLSYFVDSAFRPSTDPPTQDDIDAVKRRMYQSSLAHLARLIRTVASRIFQIEESDCLGKTEVDEARLKEVEKAIDRLVTHGVWKHPYNTSEMKAVRDALSKNQNAQQAFTRVRLDIGYAMSGDLPPDWSGKAL